MFLSLAGFSELPTPVVAHAADIVVPDDYPKIQDAIDNANDGDTIFVRAGIYHERFVVRKTVSFRGENRETTIIDGDGTGSVFYLTPSSQVSLSGFKVRNASYGVFMYHTYYHSHVITDNTLTHLDTGIAFASSLVVNNDVSGNIISNNKLGFFLSGCKKNTISGNTIVNNTIGIRLTGSEDSVCEQNIISGNTLRKNDQGIHLGSHASENTIYGNNFVDNIVHVNSLSAIESFHNTWDNGVKGNYWSDYKGQDLGGDGVGDTPYIIDEANQDRYPLMSLIEEASPLPPLWMQWWFWATIAVGITVLAGVVLFLKKRKATTPYGHRLHSQARVQLTNSS